MKIRVQDNAQGKKYLHDLTHENTTTCHFGFVEPIMVNERISKDSISLRVGQTCYLNTLSKPTFGRINIKSYASYVPFVDIYHPYESLMSGQSYRGSQGLYTPSQVPSVRQSFLTHLVQSYSTVYCFRCTPSYDANGHLDGYSNLQVVPSADQTAARTEFFNEWNDATGNLFDFTNPGNIALLGNGMLFDFPSALPADNYIESDFVHVANGTIDVTKNYIYFFNLNQVGRNLRKVLIGCGYKLNYSNREVSLLPLFAYFKTYFDLFNPPRSRTWRETYAHGFMERVEQYDYVTFAQWIADTDCKRDFINFFIGLAFCYYTQNPDFVSAHIPGSALDIATQSSNLRDADVLNPLNNSVVNISAANQGQQPVTQATVSTGYVNQSKLDLLKNLYYKINSATAIGGRIRDFLRAFYGTTEFEEPETNYIGSQKISVKVSEIVNLAQTSEGDLGEYGAKGTADDGGQTFHFETRQPGVVVVVSTFVPETRYSQAVDTNLLHLKPNDFYYRPDDSKTLLPTPKFGIYGNEEISFTGQHLYDDLSSGFGNVPSKMEYKVMFNIDNGDISLGSKRNSYLPFTLDKLLPYRFVSINPPDSRDVELFNMPAAELVASDKWRYIGRDAYIGWFNRIFINSGTGQDSSSFPGEGMVWLEDVDDNFVLYNYIDYQVNSFALPLADSFQTHDEGTATMEVEKA